MIKLHKTNKKWLMLLILLAFSGCDKPNNTENKPLTQYAEYNETLTLFSKTFNISIKSSIYLVPLKSGTLGQCSGQIIRLNENYWHNAGSLERKTLLFHELVHCELFVKHFGNGLMSTAIFNQPLAFKNSFGCQIANIFEVLALIDTKILLKDLDFANKVLELKYLTNGMTKAQIHQDLDNRIKRGEFLIWPHHNYAFPEPMGVYRSNIEPIVDNCKY